MIDITNQDGRTPPSEALHVRQSQIIKYFSTERIMDANGELQNIACNVVLDQSELTSTSCQGIYISCYEHPYILHFAIEISCTEHPLL